MHPEIASCFYIGANVGILWLHLLFFYISHMTSATKWKGGGLTKTEFLSLWRGVLQLFLACEGVDPGVKVGLQVNEMQFDLNMELDWLLTCTNSCLRGDNSILDRGLLL